MTSVFGTRAAPRAARLQRRRKVAEKLLKRMRNIIALLEEKGVGKFSMNDDTTFVELDERAKVRHSRNTVFIGDDHIIATVKMRVTPSGTIKFRADLEEYLEKFIRVLDGFFATWDELKGN